MSIQVEHYGAREGRCAETVKAWLERVWILDKQITAKNEQLACMQDQIRRCTRSLSPASGGSRRDWTDTEAELMSLEQRIREDIARLVRCRTEIYDAIAAVPDDKLRLLLELRYLNQCSWTKIAIKLECDRTTCWRLHESALESIKKFSECNAMQHFS